MIKHHEGVRYKPYRCPARLWTIGVGHVLYPAQGALPLDQRDAFQLKPEHNRTFSKDEVDGILSADLQRFEAGITKLAVKVVESIPIYLLIGGVAATLEFAPPAVQAVPPVNVAPPNI